MKTTKCDKCEREIRNNNLKKHIIVCGKNPETKPRLYEKVDDKYKCPVCFRVFSKLGINAHVWRIHGKGQQHNPNNGFVNGARKAWNKGLTKETDSVLMQRSLMQKEGYKTGKYKRPKDKNPEQTKRKISDTVKRKLKEGTWHYSFSKTRTYEYKGVRLYGKWELKYAQWLDQNNIKWRRPKEKFVYVFENKERMYNPDFYLIDSGEYIEIKGYETEKDRCKWKDFPLKLRVIKGKELFSLNIITENELKGLK